MELNTLKDSLIDVIKKTERTATVDFTSFGALNDAHSRVRSLQIVNLNNFPAKVCSKYTSSILVASVLEKFPCDICLQFAEDRLIAVTDRAYYERCGKVWVPRWFPKDAQTLMGIYAEDIARLVKPEKEKKNAAKKAAGIKIHTG